MRSVAVLGCFVCCLLGGGCQRTGAVGPQASGGHIVPTGQRLRPAGLQVEFNGRPVDMAVSHSGAALYVKDNRGIVVIELPGGRLRQELAIPGGTSNHGIQAASDGTVWITNAASSLIGAREDQGGLLKLGPSIALPKPKIGGEAYPCGFALSKDGKIAWVCLSRSNSLAKVDLESGEAAEIAVDICPYEVILNADESLAFVACWGGAAPGEGKKTAPSAGTEVEVDERGVAAGGTVAIVDLKAARLVGRVPVGLQPSGLVLSDDGKSLYVANANSDTVTVIDVPERDAREVLVVRADPRQLFGSAPNALVLSEDGKRLFAALGGNNAVAVVKLGEPSVVEGLIPVGWYPGALGRVGTTLAVANTKGIGSRAGPRQDGGHSVYDIRGSVSLVEMPDERKLEEYTVRAKEDARVGESLRSLARSAARAMPVPVPARIGEPSTIEHVVYILKENRTYDQVFGDLPQGDGEPSLCMFPREITPNHHALAEQFVLLDNYYCNGVNSADGHAWAMEANASSHLEKAFGGWTRSYPFGDDPLSYSSSGFIWDSVLGKGLTFRNYGEFDYAEPVPDASFKEIYDDFLHKAGKIKFRHNIGVERARIYANPEYPGWNMKIPDVLRAEIFLDELKEFEKKGTFPNFTIVYLPQDHLSGTQPGMPTQRAHMADNDLALGRVVEALSRSPFWKKMAIFVNEDDPQNGFDHVDGHRSLCLVISPYARRKAVVSEFYNQTSVLHTMERILGLRPMNQMDAMSPLMTACFTNKPDFTIYQCQPNNVPLDELNPPKSALSGDALKWARASETLDLSRPDAGNDDLRNRILWSAMKGSAPYPAHLAGAHGKGLKARRLVFDNREND